MPRDNEFGGARITLPGFEIDTESFMLEYAATSDNGLSRMFAENRAKKVKFDDDLRKQVCQLTEENKTLRPRLSASRKEVESLKERVKYLEAAIQELEGK